MGQEGGLPAVRHRVRRRPRQRVALPLPLLQEWRRRISGAVLHHAGGGRYPAVLHGAGAGPVPSEGRHHLLGETGTTL